MQLQHQIPYEVTAASSTTFTGGGSSAVNSNGSTYVAYCFTEVQGYSKFGSMSVMEMQMEHLSIQDSNQEQFCTKKTTGPVGSWVWHDSRMGQSTGSGTSSGTDINPATANQVMESNSNSMDDYGDIDFLSNGFKIRDTDGRVNENNSNIHLYGIGRKPIRNINRNADNGKIIGEIKCGLD